MDNQEVLVIFNTRPKRVLRKLSKNSTIVLNTVRRLRSNAMLRRKIEKSKERSTLTCSSRTFQMISLMTNSRNFSLNSVLSDLLPSTSRRMELLSSATNPTRMPKKLLSLPT